MTLCRAALLVALGSCVRPSLDHQVSPVVFGDDDRREPHEASSIPATIAREQVAVRIVDWAVDLGDPGTPRITYDRTLGESLDLCEGEPFANQIAPGSCSATLIDERHLLTAGHCVSGPEDCTDSHYWVFGFYVDTSGSLAELSSDDVYQCSRVVVSDRRADYAVLELDRDVQGREPVDVRLHEAGLPIGTPTSLVGFPDGIPAKVDEGGVVVYSADRQYFRATVDAFDSSSGSGVFDVEGYLVGILQRGHPDYVAAGDCNVVNVLDGDGDEGEIVGYPDEAMVAYCAANPDARMCTCDGPCWVAAPRDAGIDAGDAGDAMVASDANTSDATGTTDAGIESSGGCNAGGSSSQCPLLLLLVITFRVRNERVRATSARRRSTPR